MFSGAKIALILGDHLVTYLRDDYAHIPFPGHWDLPGGGREGEESPEACVLRETEEEFGLRLPQSRITWKRLYPSMSGEGSFGYFFAAPVTEAEVTTIRFGDEGQHWAMMGHDAFLEHPQAVPALQLRFGEYLAGAPSP
ncbi:MAG: NUDIX hydrolase [Pseudomonadota bacterium]